MPMNKVKQKSNWQKIRGVFNEVHLWMGIASGIIIFLVCLSGTIYTFSHEIQEVLEPQIFKVSAAEAAAEPLPAETLIRRLEEETGGKVRFLNIPADPEHTYQANVLKEGEKGRGTNYAINPYSGELIGTTQSNTSEFFMSMFRLHRWLLLDMKIGRPIVGWATVIFTLIVLTGLVIWFPQRLKSWKQGLKVKWNGNWKRTNHDLHNTLGFYSSFLLLVMALTGLTWSFDWYKEGFLNVLGMEKSARSGGRGEGGSGPVSSLPAAGEEVQLLQVADFLRIADELLPYEGDYRISLPADAAGTVSISKSSTAFFASPGSDKLQLDQYSGEPLQVDRFSDKPLNEQIASSIKPLHTGEIFGTFSKILYFIACLVATSLPVTGTIIWINKLRKKSKRKAETRPGRRRAVPAGMH